MLKIICMILFSMYSLRRNQMLEGSHVDSYAEKQVKTFERRTGSITHVDRLAALRPLSFFLSFS